MATLYYLFNFFVVLTFEQAIYEKNFLINLERIFKIDLMTQLFIYETGKGKWYYGTRYQGTFNDPNQYGFFILCCFLTIFTLMMLKGKWKRSLVWLILSLYLIIPCASTGMVLGFGVLLGTFLLFTKEEKQSGKVAWIVILIVVLVLFAMLSKGFIHLPSSIENSIIFERTLGKFTKLRQGTLLARDERGWQKVFDNPWYILFGAGDGYFYRFGGSGKEVHSSVLGPLFYYGVIPCALLFRWHRAKIRGLKKNVWCVYIALVVESITLVNNRQPMYWMLFVLAGHEMLKTEHYLLSTGYIDHIE